MSLLIGHAVASGAAAAAAGVCASLRARGTTGSAIRHVHAYAVRIAAGLAIAALVLFGTAVRLVHRPSEPYAVLGADRIAAVSGTLVDDLSVSPDSVVRAQVRLDRVVSRSGWHGDAGGLVTVFWRGSPYVRAVDPTVRVMPVRGDRVTVEDVEFPGHEAAPTVWSDGDSVRLSTRGTAGLLRRAVRTTVVHRLSRLDPKPAGLVRALVLGDRAALDPSDVVAVRRAGAAHALALSGMHLAVLAFIARACLTRLLGARRAGPAVLLILIAYVCAVGWIPSLVRALVMVAVAEAARRRDRVLPAPILLARTVLAIACLDPGMIAEAGLWLSLAALVGLMYATNAVADRMTLGGRLPRAAVIGSAASVAALATTAPVSISLFGEIYPAGMIFALPISMLVTGLLAGGLLYLAVAFVPFLGTMVGAVLGWLSLLTVRAAGWARIVPAIRPPTGMRPLHAGWAAFAIIAAAALIVLLWPRRARRDQSQLSW